MSSISFCRTYFSTLQKFFICTMLFLAGIMGDWLGYVAGGITLVNAGRSLNTLLWTPHHSRVLITGANCFLFCCHPAFKPGGYSTEKNSLGLRIYSVCSYLSWREYRRGNVCVHRHDWGIQTWSRRNQKLYRGTVLDMFAVVTGSRVFISRLCHTHGLSACRKILNSRPRRPEQQRRQPCRRYRCVGWHALRVDTFFSLLLRHHNVCARRKTTPTCWCLR